MSTKLRSTVWNPVNISGDIPGPRTKLTAVPWHNKMIIFGGGYRREFCDGIYEYDFETSSFQEAMLACDKATKPCARRSHSCVVYQEKLLIFGGRVKAGRLNDLYELDLENQLSRILHPPSAALQAMVKESNGSVDLEDLVQSYAYLEANLQSPDAQPILTDTKSLPETIDGLLRSIPCERAAHSACLYDNRWMVIYGGNSSLYDLFLDDLHLWDCERYHWLRIEPQSLCKPKGRLGHTAVIQGHSMYVFGGYGGEPLNDLWVFNFGSLQWREIIAGFSVNPSSFHAAALYNNHMIVYGGSFGDQSSDLNPACMYAFHIPTETWSVVEHTVPDAATRTSYMDLPHPGGRLGHAMVLYGNALYLFAGSDNAYYNDLHVVHLEPPSLKAIVGSYIDAHHSEFVEHLSSTVAHAPCS